MVGGLIAEVGGRDGRRGCGAALPIAEDAGIVTVRHVVGRVTVWIHEREAVAAQCVFARAVCSGGEEAVGERDGPVISIVPSYESAAGGGHASPVRIVNQSVIDAARDSAGGISAIPIANDTAVKGAAADCGADFGAHAAVLDGDMALGTAHQTAQALVCAARDGALYVEVADGGAVDVVERGAEVLGGSAVKGQCEVLSVELTLERVTALACHLR